MGNKRHAGGTASAMYNLAKKERDAADMGELRLRQTAVCKTCGGSRRVMANQFDADRFAVRASKCAETVPCPDCTAK